MTATMLPIAIVGRACVLPGALSPQALWQAVIAQRDMTRSVREIAGDRWRTDPAAVVAASTAPDRCSSDRGGYVEGFDALWDPQGFAMPAAELVGLDPLVHWLLHCARAALRDARIAIGAASALRVGGVFGNLGYPSASMAAFAGDIWMQGRSTIDPRNRAMSGGTALIAAKALGLSAGSYCVDAACATSLYAIKLACDELADGRADAMLAGAVQCADPLFLHQGFGALGALSPSGQSRPFHRDADGLLPAEGCAILALKRLGDAHRDGDRIHAVIRGIGLGNDGRGKGLLAPDEAGQQRAMRAAYASAGIAPEVVSLLECHATGTSVGDACELRSSAAVFAGANGLPIGSLKSNLGHPITVAGAAGIIKLIEALRHGVLPPNRLVDTPHPVFADTPFRLLQSAEPWLSDGPRVAAISAFGFGGNNAHLVLSDDAAPARPAQLSLSVRREPVSGMVSTPRKPGSGDDASSPGFVADVASTAAAETALLALTGIGIKAGNTADRHAIAAALFSGQPLERAMTHIHIDLASSRFPPNDLKQTLPQQLALLSAAQEALAELPALPQNTAVLIGMEPDVNVARFGLRWRLGEARAASTWIAAAKDAVIAPLQAAGVVGCMPNMPANRLSSQLDCIGPAYTVQAGPDSGLRALSIACRALSTGEIDAAIVGAVDLCCEAVTRASGNTQPGDAAIVWVLKRKSDAERDGDAVLAWLEPADSEPQSSPKTAGPSKLASTIAEAQSMDAPSRETDQISELPKTSSLTGDCGAAGELLRASVGALMLMHRRTLDGRPWLSATPRTFHIGTDLILREAAAYPLPVASRLHIYAGADKAAVIAALRDRRPSLVGSARAVLIAADADLPAVRDRALAHLCDGAPAGANVYFSERPINGEIAFVFAGAGASYPGMGREFLERYPALLDRLAARSRRLLTALDWSVEGTAKPSAIQQLWGASALSQLHLEFSEALGLRADAWLGYSSGETNALVAAGVWADPDALMDEMDQAALIATQLGGEFAAVAPQWDGPVRWASWNIIAPVDEVRAAIGDLAHVHLAIINADNDCLIAGDAHACDLAVARLGAARCIALDYPIAVHVPELRAVRDTWYRLHLRASFAPRSGRVYSTANGCAYTPSSAACAQAILDQAERTLDLRPVVLQAWNDGVRVFIEHGPGGTFARAIRSILGEREALVVSLDRKGGDGSLAAAAALLAAGVAVDIDARHATLDVRTAPIAQRPLQLPAHWPIIEWPVEAMTPAPALPELESAIDNATVGHSRGHGDPTPSILQIEAKQSQCISASAGVTAGSPTATFELSIAASVAATLAELADQHRRHITLCSAAHQQFLAMRTRGQELLFRAHSQPGTGERRAALGPVDLALPPETRNPIRAERSSAFQPRSATPVFDRAALEVHASGRISGIFGADFAAQDAYVRQVRMPQPPLLLADRVVDLDGAPGSMGKGRIVTETDVDNHAWAMHAGRMPAGVLIEAGQADLMLISWLGVDAHNRGERVYRLLGCELTYHGDLPFAGDTLRFDIHLDGHAVQNEVRLMFFHSDCVNGDRRQLSVRQGQAGFFSDEELASSMGCLWRPETQAIVAQPRLDPPLVACTRTALERAHLEAFAEGDAAACFGPGFELARTHTRTPGIGKGLMLLLDRVTQLQPNGGPWRRGYLRAELDIHPNQWFFDGHFKNDACMPGTLMFEACLQAMAIVLAAGGHTLKRDGWRFQPVPELPYQLQCRGQVTPRSKLLVTEVFVEELIAAPVPTVYADLLCSVDGLKAFHARRVALQLVPDWPLDEFELSLASFDDAPSATATSRNITTRAADGVDRATRLAAGTEAAIPIVDGFCFDRRSLLACALGRPSDAFGPMYRRFDNGQRVARLPSPPYHFITRIAQIDGAIGVMKKGARVVAEYDVPDRAWYFEANHGAMPFAVLLEAALQPCGWLSSYVGSALSVETELGFRNLDGEGEVLLALEPGCGTLITEVELTDVSSSAGMIIESFSVRCHLNGRDVYRLRTVFGFFPPEALAAQAGLPANVAHRELLELTQFQAAGSIPASLPTGMLRMLDRIEGWWPHAGAAGLGLVRAAKDVDSRDWFFKAHFFQDPVQPGSLGLEAMLQTLQWVLSQDALVRNMHAPRFESIALDKPHAWKYRGQVLPHHRCMQVTLEVTDRGTDARGVYAFGNASLWVDGQRIYEARGLGVRAIGR
mgnify:CR=1 FL=1